MSDATPKTTLRWGSATDTGQIRTNNEDTALARDGLWAVADGMGGHAGGEVASAIAAKTFDAQDPGPLADDVAEAVRAANRAIAAEAVGNEELRGMGTTLVGLKIVERDGDEEVAIVNVGDSRCYRLHHGELSQITVDHTLVGDLLRAGQLTEEEARYHPQRNIITRVLGNLEEDPEVDVFTVIPWTGDRYLLCSDGLFDELAESKIATVLRRIDDPDQAAAELVRLANESGGRDNITVVIVDVIDDGGRAEAASLQVEATPGIAAAPDSANASTADDTQTLPIVGAGLDGGPDPSVEGSGLDDAHLADDSGDNDTIEEGDGGDGEYIPRESLSWRTAIFIGVIVVLATIVGGALIWYSADPTDEIPSFATSSTVSTAATDDPDATSTSLADSADGPGAGVDPEPTTSGGAAPATTPSSSIPPPTAP